MPEYVIYAIGAFTAATCLVIGWRMGRGLSPLASPFPMRVKIDKPKPADPPKPQETI